MTFIRTIWKIIASHTGTHPTVDAKVENAVFDLKRATRNNIATTKLLNEVLTAR